MLCCCMLFMLCCCMLFMLLHCMLCMLCMLCMIRIASSASDMKNTFACSPGYYQIWIYHMFETMMASQKQMLQHFSEAARGPGL